MSCMYKKPAGGAIPPLALKIAVSAYLLWVIYKVVAGILTGAVMGRSALLLAVACTALFAGAAGLLAGEWLRYRKRRRLEKAGEQPRTESL